MIESPGSVGFKCADIAYLIFAILFLFIFAGGIVAGLFSVEFAFAAAGGAWFLY